MINNVINEIIRQLGQLNIKGVSVNKDQLQKLYHTLETYSIKPENHFSYRNRLSEDNHCMIQLSDFLFRAILSFYNARQGCIRNNWKSPVAFCATDCRSAMQL